MRLSQFPDIHWLRAQAKTNFSNQRAVDNLALVGKGWPSVVLNTRSLGAERTDIIAPFSLFLNLAGNSLLRSEGKEITLTADNFCIVNKGHTYDLIIPENATTFNIHFGDTLFSDIVSTLQKKHEALLDSPLDLNTNRVDFNAKSIWKNETLKKSLAKLQLFYHQNKLNEFADHREFELLSKILSMILTEQGRSLSNLSALSSTKVSTRKELMSRLTTSVDYIHAHYHRHISLDELSVVACLSKYHYSRTFKEVYRCTPQQMIAKCRLEKAKSLILSTQMSLSDIGLAIGFSELPAFSRFFNRSMGVSAQSFRNS